MHATWATGKRQCVLVADPPCPLVVSAVVKAGQQEEKSKREERK
jgi:hypothetical protein